MATKRYLQRIAKAYPEIEQSGRWKPKIPKANEIDVEHYVQRIREAFPEFQNAGYKRIDDFGDHLMFLLNDRYIFRFVIGNKTEDIIKLLREQAVLERLKGTVGIPVPNYTYLPKTPDFAGYEMIPGICLSPAHFRNLSEENRADAAVALGKFLSTVHTFPVEQAIELGVEEGRPRSPRGVERRFYRHASNLDPEVRRVCKRWLNDIQTRPDYTPTFTHSDVWYQHIYHDPKSGRLTGIIDWGDIRLMDPAYDVAGMWAYGEAFVDSVLANYPRTDSSIKSRALYHYKSTVVSGLVYPRQRGRDISRQLLSDNFDL